jgi:hypothetical protein
MDPGAIKSPSARITATGQAHEFSDTLFGVVVCECPQVVANQLIEALAHCLGLFLGPGNNALVDRDGQIHDPSIRESRTYSVLRVRLWKNTSQ